MEDQRSSGDLWREYAFFTHEMVRFFDKDDIDMFITLHEEQKKAQMSIIGKQDDGFLQTQAARELRQKLEVDFNYLKPAIQRWLNDARGKQQQSRSYDSLGKAPVGNSRDWGV